MNAVRGVQPASAYTVLLAPNADLEPGYQRAAFPLQSALALDITELQVLRFAINCQFDLARHDGQLLFVLGLGVLHAAYCERELRGACANGHHSFVLFHLNQSPTP